MAWDTGEGAKGAAGGAATGAVVGSVVPGIGTGVGAVGGALIGGLMGGFGGGNKASTPEYNNRYNLPGFQSQYDAYGRLAGHYDRRKPWQINESGFRPDQQALVKMLQQQAAGRGPGQELVRMQAQQMADRSAAQQLAASQGQVGGGAMAARNAALGTAAAQSQVGGQAAMGGLAAQLGATEQLGGVLQGARGQDLARNTTNANLGMQNRQLNQEAQLEALRQRLIASQMQQQGGLEFNRNASGYNQALLNVPTLGDKLMGMGAGFGQAYMTRKG